MKTLPRKAIPFIFVISIGFGILAAQYFESTIIGVAVAMLVSMLMIEDLEQEE